MKIASRHLSVLVFLVLVSSCASGREIVQLEIQRPPLAAKNGIQIVLRTVEDARVFNEDGQRPDAPSLRSRPAEAAALQARTVGRKRNMYNDPEGEWLLERDKTVADVIAELTEAVLTAEGYEVVTDPLTARSDAIALDVSIKEYWAWGEAKAFFSIIHVRTVVALTFSPDVAPPETLRVESSRQSRVPGKYDWQETFRTAHEQYITALRELLSHITLAPPEPDFSQDAPLPSADLGANNTSQSADSPAEALETSTDDTVLPSPPVESGRP